MKASEAFGVAIRSVGLLLVLSAMWQLFSALMNTVGGAQGSPIAGLLVSGVPTLLVGLWLLRGAPVLVRFAFPEER